MVASTQFQPQNQFALFSPDQWANQFSNFNNKAYPWPSSYVGMPTDAMGNPIQPPPGMTINNSAPQAAAPAPAAPAPQGNANMGASRMLYQQGLNNTNTGTGSWGGNQYGGGAAAANSAAGQAEMATAQALDPTLGYGPGGAGGLTDWAARAQGINPYPNLQPPQQPAAAPAPAAQSGPTYPQILSMLANPGKVTTPGATIPAAASAQPGPGSLQAFLQNWQPAQSGPGSGFQQGFGNALKGMGY